MNINMKIVSALAVTLLVAGCSSKSQTGSQTDTAGTGIDSNANSGSVIPGSEQDLAQNVGDRVLFELDHSDLSQEARQTLDRQAAWLKQYSSVRVTLEGHCDERGTREYNMALGARRANAARAYLVALGIQSARIQTVSYGAERPAVLGTGETVWSQNRRAVTVVAQAGFVIPSSARMRLASTLLLGGLALCGQLAVCGRAVAQENTAAQNELRFQQLEDQVRNLTGQVENQGHQIEVLNQQLEKLRGDTDLRLNDLEGKGGAPVQAQQDTGGQIGEAAPPAGPRYAAPPQNYAPPQSYEERGYSQPPAGRGNYAAPTPLYPGAGQPGPGAPPRTLGSIPAGPVPSVDPAEVQPQSPQGQYQAAYALIGQGQFGAAQQAFQAFIQQYPRDPLASSAAYWVGHSYYARGDFQNASVALADAYKKYPKGNKSPDTLLELGRSLARLDQVPSACATFGQFDKQFGTGAPPLIKRQVEQEKTRLRCG